MRGPAVAGPRPSQGVAAQIKNADFEDVSQLGVELLARPASALDQRRLTHRNPDLRVTSVDQRGAPIADLPALIPERVSSTLYGHSALRSRNSCTAPEMILCTADLSGSIGHSPLAAHVSLNKGANKCS